MRPGLSPCICVSDVPDGDEVFYTCQFPDERAFLEGDRLGGVLRGVAECREDVV